MLYTYTAKNMKGETYDGKFDAKSKIELYAKVRGEGGRILSVREKGGFFDINSFGSIFGRVNTHDKILLAKNLGSMLAAGLSMTRALEVMEKQTRKKTLRDLLHSLTEDVSKGDSLSDALKKRANIFPAIFISMTKAGEESGKLAEALSVIASQMDKSYTLTKRVRGAMIYPAVILSLMVVIAILLLIYMVPTLTSTFQGLGIELPLSTRIIIAMSRTMVDHTLIFLGAIVIFVLAAAVSLRSKLGGQIMDSVFVKLPVIGMIVKEVNSARTARTLSSLLSAGVPIVNALEVTENVVGNHLYKEALNDARAAIQKGETVSAVLGRYESIYPAFISEMTAVGEETGKISEMLLNVAVYYEEDVEEKTKDLSTIIEPLLMIIIGGGVGIFALSMLAPTYSLVNNI
ncbi:type II secretion system F family protein [Candidatus Parcubacteria bacterium]|nr:type II secretion system F family protein [Candidatus Parcubacteria bacterium]